MDLGLINDLYQTYVQFQQNHPNLSAMISAEIVYVGGDIASQLIKERKLNLKKLRYTATLAPIYGLCIDALIESGEMVGRMISENPLVKAALGPNLFGNVYNTFFFVNNKVGQENDYSIKSLVKNYYEIFSPQKIKEKGFYKNFKDRYIAKIPKEEYKKSIIYTLTGWNLVQAFNYYAIPQNMRTAFSLGISTIWATMITSWSRENDAPSEPLDSSRHEDESRNHK